MRRFFAKNLLFVVGINLLVKPLWVFAIDREVQNRVGHDSYGSYGALLNLAIIFQILLDFGLNAYASRRISADPGELPRLFPALAGARLLLTGVYVSIVLALALAFGYRGSELLLLCGTLLIQTLTIFTIFVRGNIAALQRFRLDGLLSITDKALMIVVCGLLLWIPGIRDQFGIRSFVLAQIGCYAVALAAGLILLRRISGISLLPVFRPSVMLPVVRQGAPYALLIFLMAVYMRADTMLVERISGKAEAGIYAQAVRLLDVFNMISIIVAGVLLPLFGRMLAERQSVAPIVRISVNLLVPASVIAALSMWTFGEEILHRLYPAAGAYDGRVAAWLLSALPAYSMMYVYNTLLTAVGRLRLLNYICLPAAILSLILNAALIPRYGALGAGIAAVITMSLMVSATTFFAWKKLDLPAAPRWIAAHIAYAAMLGAVALLLHARQDVSWMLRFGAFLVAGGLLYLPFRFVSVKSLMLLVRR